MAYDSLYSIFDDTLAHWPHPIPKHAAQKVRDLRSDDNLFVAILTNATHNRTKKVSEALGVDDILFVQQPSKPLTGGFKKIFSHYNIPPHQMRHGW
jgi:predicted HAD superfamily phosphohydrolase YqeG